MTRQVPVVAHAAARVACAAPDCALPPRSLRLHFPASQPVAHAVARVACAAPDCALPPRSLRLHLSDPRSLKPLSRTVATLRAWAPLATAAAARSLRRRGRSGRGLISASLAQPSCRESAAPAEALKLTESERKIFKVMLDTIEYFRLGTVVRVAGGWVRDKLLGGHSDDIDIVVDDMTGEEFALKVKEYMVNIKASDAASNVGVVKQNPDQSKHLATACFRLFGLSLDVNSLRAEEYAEESRIPTTRLGTATEDALRRDFTINSLFYNINNGTVEDLVGSGLVDLRNGIICTPLHPNESFRDDPLRMLRAVRFAARLGFRVDSPTLDAISCVELQELIETKVSRERRGLEVEKMMKEPRGGPVRALSLMKKARMLGIVFIPPEIVAGVTETLRVEALEQGVERVESVTELLAALPQEIPELHLGAATEEADQKVDERPVLYAALLSAWLKLTVRLGKKPEPLISALLRAALKIDLATCQAAQNLAAAAEVIRASAELPDPARRLAVGTHLRVVGDSWPRAVALALALRGGESREAMRVSLHREMAWVHASGLLGCWEWKPMFDGRQLMAPPFSVPKGAGLREAMDAQLRWRLEDPGLTEEACAERLLDELARTA